MRYLAVLALICPALCAHGAEGGLECSGLVLDAQRAPVSGADVWLTQNRQVSKTVSDIEGRFRFEHANLGRAEVVAWKQDGRHAIGGLDLNLVGPGSVTIYLGEPVETTLVITGDSGPVAGARLRALAVNELFHVSAADLDGHGFPSLRSDASGEIVLPMLPKGSYFGFVVSHRDYADAALSYLPAGRRQAVRMQRGGVISGRVTDSEGEGVARARVSVFSTTAQGQQEQAERLTGPDGFYRIPVMPGSYRVTAAHADYAHAYPEPASIESADDEATANLVLPEAFEIAGRVLGPEGDPAPAVRLTYTLSGVVVAAGQTNYEGRFSLAAPAGEGVLQVHPPPGLATEMLPRRPVAIVSQDAHMETPIRLKRLPHVRGRIVGPQGDPAPYAVVTALNSGAPQWVVANGAGAFVLAPERMPEDKKLRLRAEHRLRFLAKEVSRDLDEEGELVIELEAYSPEAPEMTEDTTQNDLLHMVGKPAPEWECETWVNGDPVRLADLRGKVVVLTLWGAFQERGPGRLHVERIRMLSQLFADVGDVAFIGIHDASLDTWMVEHFARLWDIGFPVGRDADPFLTFDRYNTTFIPNTILIDKKGVLRFFDVDAKLLELIKALRLRG